MASPVFKEITPPDFRRDYMGAPSRDPHMMALLRIFNGALGSTFPLLQGARPVAEPIPGQMRVDGVAGSTGLELMELMIDAGGKRVPDGVDSWRRVVMDVYPIPSEKGIGEALRDFVERPEDRPDRILRMVAIDGISAEGVDLGALKLEGFYSVQYPPLTPPWMSKPRRWGVRELDRELERVGSEIVAARLHTGSDPILPFRNLPPIPNR